ncbi:unnamed protein product, partial [Musa acuminata subsp. burmannicoides]
MEGGEAGGASQLGEGCVRQENHLFPFPPPTIEFHNMASINRHRLCDRLLSYAFESFQLITSHLIFFSPLSLSLSL